MEKVSTTTVNGTRLRNLFFPMPVPGIFMTRRAITRFTMADAMRSSIRSTPAILIIIRPGTVHNMHLTRTVNFEIFLKICYIFIEFSSRRSSPEAAAIIRRVQ